MPSPLSSLLKILRLTALSAVIAVASSALAADPSVTARFDPSQLAVGQTGTYLLDFHNTSGSPKGNVPLLPGLKLQFVGTQTMWEMNSNTGATSTLRYQFQVQPEKPGNYTLPSFNIDVGGASITVPPATLVVTDQPVASASGAQPISLAAKVPSTQVYVGEKFPLDIMLAVRDDLRLIGLGGLTQNGDAFEQAQSNMRQESDESTFQQDDHSYDAHSWHTAITALTSGPQTLRFSMPVAVMRMGNPFGGQTDDLIARMFGNSGLGFGQQQQLNIDSTPLTFDVQPLPADGRPGNFTGGIGLFDLTDPSLSSTALQVGVPVTLTLTVSGQGNFDRLHAPVIDTGALWRSYKPKETFTPDPSDPTGYHGTKTFEYVLMPLSQNITDLPPPQFNFFNPDTKTYVDLTPKSIPVTVQPAAPGQAVPLPAVSNNVVAATPTLVGPRTEPGAWVSPTLTPIFYSSYFLGAQAAPAILLATLVITRRRRLRLETDPAYARQLRAHRSALAAVAKARSAAAAGLAAEFYATAQRALQEAASYSTEWRQESSAEALTWPEFDAHLTARGVSAEVHAAAREIFEAGDALRFGGFTPDQSVLADAANRLDGLVRQLLRA